MSGQDKKRGRTDGQVSKEEYAWSEGRSEHASIGAGPHGPGTFQRADAATLAQRRMVTGARKSKKGEFLSMVKALNTSFTKWVAEQLRVEGGADAKTTTLVRSADLTEGVEDYLVYIAQLQGRYLRKPGMVLTYGAGDCGQLAHGEEDEDLNVKYPRVVHSLRDKKVAGIACGGLHNVCFTEDGALWTWGCNDDGALGRDGVENMPGMVTNGDIGDDSIVAVAAGDVQSMAVGLSGAVYGFGSYKDKEGKQWFDPVNGHSAKHCKRKQVTPMLIPGLENIIEIVCGASFNLALAQDGSVYSWGIGEVGELGRPVCDMKYKFIARDPATGKNEEQEEYQFEQIRQTHLTPARMLQDSGRPISGVKTIGCGAYHSFIVTAVNAHVMASGLNNYGQLGLGDDGKTNHLQRLTVIEALEGLGITSITGGTHHSVALSMGSGKLFAFGRMDSGQLGITDTIPDPGKLQSMPQEVTLGTSTSKPVMIACGAFHTMALTSANELYSWGYGDMLALGHGSDKDQSRPRAVNFSKAGFESVTVLVMDGGGQHTALIADVIEKGGRA